MSQDISPWHSSAELPKGDQKVLICWLEGGKYLYKLARPAFLKSGADFYIITGIELPDEWFWMPLPKPPKGEKT